MAVRPRRLIFAVSVGAVLLLLTYVLRGDFQSPFFPVGRLKPSANAHERRQYSWMQCIGNNVNTRSCHFKNVCLKLHPPDPIVNNLPIWEPRDLAFQDLFYYTPSAAYNPFEPGLAGSDSTIDPFLATSPILSEEAASRITPKVVYSQVPKNARWADATHTAYLASGLWTDNFAHALGDDFLPAFSLLKMWNFPPRKSKVIFHPSCRDRQYLEKGCEHHAEMSSLLFDHPTESYHSLNLGDSLLCFPNLAIGSRALPMYHKTADWPALAEEMKRHAKIDTRLAPLRHQVVVMKKTNRRVWLNDAELVTALRRWLHPIPVLHLHPEETHFYDQLSLVHASTVLLSPCGGVSFISMFLPFGSSAIYSDFWSVDRNESQSIESYI